MYTSENKGFTVITDFGCDQNCPYCITRLHPILAGSKTKIKNIDWGKLEKCISESSAPTINLSGGGDPLFGWRKHKIFFLKMKEIADKYGKSLDIHTRILPRDPLFISFFRKFAVSIEYTKPSTLRSLKTWYQKYARGKTLVRAIQVIDSKITDQELLDLVRYIKDECEIFQVTLRQMFGNKAASEHYEELKKKFDGVWNGVMFLDDGEHHNYYFTTNNTLYPYFFGNSEEDRLKWKKEYENKEQSCN